MQHFTTLDNVIEEEIKCSKIRNPFYYIHRRIRNMGQHKGPRWSKCHFDTVTIIDDLFSSNWEWYVHITQNVCFS